MEEQRRRRADGRERQRFALAFSGGGIRAAAFQAGVLWRLAEEGRLRDVDYLVAVSGGAYIASSFASELHSSPPPSEGSDVDAWYRGAVARTICRMQRNAGDFVRDPEQTGCLAWFDTPLLLLMAVLTVLANPLEILLIFVVPLTEAIQLFFGAALRASVCATEGGWFNWKILYEWSPFGWLVSLLPAFLLLTFLLWALGRMLGSDEQDKSRRQHRLWVQASQAFFMRLTAGLFLLLVLVAVVPCAQLFSVDRTWTTLGASNPQKLYCANYVRLMEGGTADGAALAHPAASIRVPAPGGGTDMGCSNFYDGKAWYADPALKAAVSARVGGVDTAHSQAWTLKAANLAGGFFFSSLGWVLLGSLVLAPFFPGLALSVLSFAGPAFLFVSTVVFVQYRTYGPVTGQPLFMDLLYFNYDGWHRFVKVCFCADVCLLVFYRDVRGIWHRYYRGCLRSRFFHDRRDVCLPKLLESPYCPFLLLTGTVNDYIGPESGARSTCEISFSSLHTGSTTTGYVRTPPGRSLSKCTALAGAGCLDAIALSMAKHVQYRFWLEMLNLSWGDSVLFLRREPRFFRWAKEVAGDHRAQILTHLAYRCPDLLICWSVLGLFCLGWVEAHGSTGPQCNRAKDLVAWALYGLLAFVALSYFSFLGGLGWILHCPVIRQLHQATQTSFRGDVPPSLLYVTDGGVRDCTGIVQLMQRRCPRILLVLANADPRDELAVLRAAIQDAAEQRLGSVYDPDDARRDLRILLEEFQRDQTKTSLRLGIRYGWDVEDGKGTLGQLVVVKNRLPPSLEELPAEPLLTEEEVRQGGGSRRNDEAKATSRRARDLGGWGCCDCCHRHGCNCGPKFPHLTAANYLWLTPTLFGSLCRLGHDLSEEAINTVVSAS